jgi:hypothetical protein
MCDRGRDSPTKPLSFGSGTELLWKFELVRGDIARVLAVADAKIFHKSYGDQNGELWSPNGSLLATTTQIAYFKA